MDEDELRRKTANMKLPQILSLCGEITTSRTNPCFNFPDFWRDTITRLYGNIVVLQRGDLTTGREWHNFAGYMATGISYKYRILHRANGWENVAKPFVPLEQIDEDSWAHQFDIPGALPKKGTKGFFVRLYLDGSAGSIDEGTFFINPNPKVALDLAKRYVGDYFHSKMAEFVLGACTLDGGGDEVEEFPTFPAADLFIRSAKAARTNSGYWILDWSRELVDPEEGYVVGAVREGAEFTWELVDITF
uniref:Uncharacterized protein n=1 Tax=viral metagenome TaxID=1070528 RepID=A0A6C0CJ49_9ZZZZ